MADLQELFEQYPLPSVTFLKMLMRVGTWSTVISAPPIIYIIYTSFSAGGHGVPWLRGWLGIFLLFQLCQLPLRLALQRHLNIIGAGEVADIPFNLALMVASPFWKVVKVFGYGVYAMFALGVLMSWHFSDPVSSPDYLRSTVMIVCLLVVLRMIFSFAWFFYMFMYTDELPFLPNPRAATEDMLACIHRYTWRAPSEHERSQHSERSTQNHSDASTEDFDTTTSMVRNSTTEKDHGHIRATPSPPPSPSQVRRRLVSRPAHPSPSGSSMGDRVPSSSSMVSAASAPARHVKVLPPPNHEDTCPICMVEYEADDDMAQLPCHPSHVFHYECVRQWFRQSTACPMCAMDLRRLVTQPIRVGF